MNIKKCTGLFLAFLLLVSNIGFALDVHYCGGKIASISLNTTSKPVIEKKCCGSKEKKNSCCKDKHVQIEKKSENATLKFFFFQFDFPAVIQEYKPLVFAAVSSFKTRQTLSYYADANAPPYSNYIISIFSIPDFNVKMLCKSWSRLCTYILIVFHFEKTSRM